MKFNNNLKLICEFFVHAHLSRNYFFMQPEQIMSLDLLDILFADRNKMYGAYPLRRGYNKRLSIALLTTGGIVALSLMFYYTSGKPSVLAEKIKVNDSIHLVELIPDEPAPPIPPPPPPPPPPEQQVLTRSFTNPPQIVAEPDEKDKPPTVDELDIARIALFNQDGVMKATLLLPPCQATTE